MTERDEYAIVLDFLAEGRANDKRPSHRKTSLAQVVGKKRFTLLEIQPKEGTFLNLGDEVYIGEGKREQVQRIEGRITTDELTNTAQGELSYVVETLVTENEKDFIDFFNKARPLSTRMHSLELLPGLGKKHMWEVLEAREEQLFTSFEDIKERVKLLPDPKKLVIRRIMNELSGNEKHKLFIQQ
ncbi:MAG: DUF655 domain-containing protein [Candidatus Woesearchaeota archaeon]